MIHGPGAKCGKQTNVRVAPGFTGAPHLQDAASGRWVTSRVLKNAPLPRDPVG